MWLQLSTYVIIVCRRVKQVSACFHIKGRAQKQKVDFGLVVSVEVFCLPLGCYSLTWHPRWNIFYIHWNYFTYLFWKESKKSIRKAEAHSKKQIRKAAGRTFCLIHSKQTNQSFFFLLPIEPLNNSLWLPFGASGKIKHKPLHRVMLDCLTILLPKPVISKKKSISFFFFFYQENPPSRLFFLFYS